MTKDFMSGSTPVPRDPIRRGGTTAELRVNSRTATTDGSPNSAGYGRGNVNPAPAVVGAGGGRGVVNPPPANPGGAGGGRGEVNPPPAIPHGQSSSNKGSFDFSTATPKQKITPNIMDNYDAITYHWKLYIVHPEKMSRGEIFDNQNQTIIAESSVTDLTIDGVEIRSVCTPTVETGTGTATNIKFDIVEPGGAGMLDKMFYEAISLGIGNWATMPVYLQLQLRARSPEDSSADYDRTDDLTGLTWVWPIKITNIKTNVTNVGTTYSFDAIHYNDFALSNAVTVLKSSTTLSDLTTFGDAMKKLEDKLNQDQLISLISNYSIPDTYRIVVDPILARENITEKDQSSNPRRSGDYVKFENKTATFGPSTSVDKVIDTLLAHTSKYQTNLSGTKTAGGDEQSVEELPSQMRKLWRIVTETRPLKYDIRRNDFAKEYIYYVVEYDIGVMESTVDQTLPVNGIEYAKQRLAEYAKRSVLRKKYNYIFTGLNDQIYEFNITLNNAHAVALARFNGLYSNLSLYDPGANVRQNQESYASVSKLVSDALSAQNDNIALDFAYDQVKSTTGISEDDRKRFLVLLEQAKPESRLGFLSRVQDAGGLQNDGTLNTAKINAVSLATPTVDSTTNNPYYFLSDIDTTAKTVSDRTKAFAEATKGKLRPVARIETMQDRQIGQGLESNRDTGIQKLSSIFSVALHSDLDNSFANVRMVIKGDPFWLAPGPADTSVSIFNSLRDPSTQIDWIKKSHLLRTVDYVNINGSDNFFVLSFRTPRVYDGDLVETVQNEMFSGIFKVTTVVSRFEKGVFKQELTAIIDPELKVLDLEQELKLLDSQYQTPSTVKDVMSPTATTRTSRVGIPPAPTPRGPNATSTVINRPTRGGQ